MTCSSLPDWPVAPWQMHPRLRRLGYVLREDEDQVYLIFGAEEIVATFEARTATVRLLDMAIQRDVVERLWAALPLNRRWGFMG